MQNRPKPHSIQIRPLTDYTPALPLPASGGILVSRHEENLRRLPNRQHTHRHEYFEAFWLDGEGEHSNDFHTFRLRGPTLLFVSPGQVHCWGAGSTLRGPMVAFTRGFFDGDSPPPSALLEFSFWFPERLTPLAVAAVDVAAFATVWAEITAEFHSRAAGYETVLRALLRVLFVRAHRLYEHQASVRDGKAPVARDASRLTRRFRLAVEDHFRRLAAVGDYARLLGVRPEHLSASVLAATGRPAGELIRQRLLLEARRLLLHTGQTVAEIAYGLGFADPAYFSRFFRRASGLSPGEFRAECEAKYPY